MASYKTKHLQTCQVPHPNLIRLLTTAAAKLTCFKGKWNLITGQGPNVLRCTRGTGKREPALTAQATGSVVSTSYRLWQEVCAACCHNKASKHTPSRCSFVSCSLGNSTSNVIISEPLMLLLSKFGRPSPFFHSLAPGFVILSRAT